MWDSGGIGSEGQAKGRPAGGGCLWPRGTRAEARRRPLEGRKGGKGGRGGGWARAQAPRATWAMGERALAAVRDRALVSRRRAAGEA